MIPADLNQIITQLMATWHPLLGVLPRVMTAFMILPLLTRAFVPRQVRIGFALILAVVAYPAMDASLSGVDWGADRWIFFIIKEIFIGFLIGYSVGIFLWSFASAGELMDNQAAFNNAQIFNPFGGGSGGPFALFMAQFGIMLFVGFGGLNVFTQILYESFILWPPSSSLPDLGVSLSDFVLSSSSSFLELATRFAAPVIGVLLLIELGVGLINRAAPQFNAFYVSMPIKAVVAFLILALLISHLVDAVRGHIAEMPNIPQRLDNII